MVWIMDFGQTAFCRVRIKHWFSSGSRVLRLTGFSRVWAFGTFHWVRIKTGLSIITGSWINLVSSGTDHLWFSSGSLGVQYFFIGFGSKTGLSIITGSWINLVSSGTDQKQVFIGIGFRGCKNDVSFGYGLTSVFG